MIFLSPFISFFCLDSVFDFSFDTCSILLAPKVIDWLCDANGRSNAKIKEISEKTACAPPVAIMQSKLYLEVFEFLEEMSSAEMNPTEFTLYKAWEIFFKRRIFVVLISKLRL